MTSEDETIKELGLTPEEFEQRKEEWAKALEKSIAGKRKELLLFMRSVCGKTPSAEVLRRLSWVHSYRTATDVEYHSRWLSSLPFELPLKIGSSNQDRYHQVHFISATLLCLHSPGDARQDLAEMVPPEIVSSFCSIGEDVSARLELRQEVYSHLASLIPQDQRPSRDTITLTRIYTKLQAIEDKVDKCLNSRKKKKQPTQ